VKAERGFVILAANTAATNYVKCAVQLAHSIRRWSQYPVCIVTNDPVPADTFDHVIPWPRPLSVNAFANDWQAWLASPFRQTIKLESDMLITSSIDHWWDILQHRDVVISTGSRDFYNNISTSRFYRKLFDSNNLPDVYNAITYWRYSQTSVEFWLWVRRIFENWDKYKSLLKFPDMIPTTDVVYAMVAQIMGPENVTMPFTTYPKIVHMKRHLIPIQSNDWTKELVWEMDDNRLSINTVAQNGLFHYHVKDWNPYE
jgi:hypothetical protein